MAVYDAMIAEQTVSFHAELRHAEIIGISDHFNNIRGNAFEQYRYEVQHNGLLLGTELDGHKWAREAADYITELTAHIPPKAKQYIRRYGLYSSRSRGVWQRMEFCVRLAPQGWKEKHPDNPADAQHRAAEMPECAVEKKQERSAWARLIKRVYGTDPLSCPRCGADMKILTILMDAGETQKILRHLIKIGRSPPHFDPTSLN